MAAVVHRSRINKRNNGFQHHRSFISLLPLTSSYHHSASGSAANLASMHGCSTHALPEHPSCSATRWQQCPGLLIQVRTRFADPSCSATRWQQCPGFKSLRTRSADPSCSATRWHQCPGFESILLCIYDRHHRDQMLSCSSWPTHFHPMPYSYQSSTLAARPSRPQLRRWGYSGRCSSAFRPLRPLAPQRLALSPGRFMPYLDRSCPA